MRQMTAKGRAFIEKEEGLRLEAYDDHTGRPVPQGGHVQGVLTIGYGHTGPDVLKGMRISKEQADALFDKDNDRFEACVERNMVGPKGELPNDNQFDAAVSLAYNIGEGAFASSSVVRNWKKGLWTQAGDAFALFRKDKFGDNDVLIARRAREQAVFFTPAAPYLGLAEMAAPKPLMPQEVMEPAGAAKSPTVWGTVATATGGATILASNAQPALDAVNSAVNVAQQATSTWASIKDLFSVLNNGHVLTVIILTVTVGIGIYVGFRVVRRIWSGQAKA